MKFLKISLFAVMQNKLLSITFFISCLLLVTGFKHEYYVTVFEMELNKEDKKLECSAKVFTNDLERVLKEISSKGIKLDLKEQKETVDLLMEDYLLETVSFTQGNTQKTISYLGYEYKRDETFVYFTVDDLELNDSIKCYNNWFIKEFRPQVNIVHFKSEAEKQTEYFRNEGEVYSFLLDD